MCWTFEVHLFRQVLVLSATCLFSFNCGIMLAFPSILNPVLLSPNSTDITASLDEVSWIAASHGISSYLGFVILTPIFQKVGRKITSIMINAFILVGWIIFYFSNSVISLICARLVQGLVIGGIFIIAVILSENSDPVRRGYFMTLKKVTLAFGSLSCHALGLVWTWRQIAALATISSCIAIAILLICPESPAFLAMTGRFEECKKSFQWLFGQSPEMTKQLKDLISARLDNVEQKKPNKISHIILETARILLKKDFQRPLYIVIFSTLAVDACGRYFMFAYIIQIMIEITGNKSVSIYCSVASDCLLIVALSFSCLLVKRFSRRALMFNLGFLSVFLMFLVSVTIVIRTYSLIPEVKWLTPCFVLLHSFVAHIGLVPVTFAIMCEIFPLEYRGLGAFISGLVFSTFYSLTLKFTPLMITKTGIEGTYFIYGLCVLVCLVILFFILPETKDRTLQEIEDDIKGVKRNTANVKSVLLNDSDV